MNGASNQLLAALPRRAYQQLLPALMPVTMEFGEELYEANRPIRHVFFPGACLVSLLTPVEGHPPLEVGMVGPEGMVGVPLALGVDVSPVSALVQGGGPALRMSKRRFSSALRHSPALRREVYAYIHSLMSQISQTAVCNRFHFVEARLARWLLMTRDRVGAEEFRMTQKFLSSMLGVRREGVTEAASSFQRQKLIQYSRGRIRILNHFGLESACCPCYQPPSARSEPFTVPAATTATPVCRPTIRPSS